MSETVVLHLWRLCTLFVLGTAVEVFLEMYTAFRACFRLRRTLRAVADALFAGLGWSGVVFCLFFINAGELRLYVVVALVLGFSLARYTLGKDLRAAFRRFLFGPAARCLTRSRQMVTSSLLKISSCIRSTLRRLISRFMPPA